MTNSEFKTGLAKCLGLCGFPRVGKVFARGDLGVLTLVNIQSSSFGKQWWINVGFWLERLGGHRPDKVEHTHLYSRLEGLFPEYGETILTAGDLGKLEQPAILVGDPKGREQRSAYQQLLELFPGRIGPGLRVLGTEAGLRTAMMEGRLVHCLIRKEARAWLLSPSE